VAQIRRIHSTEAILCSLHITKKAIAHGRHRCDVARLARVIPQQTPQQRNAAGERVFRDGYVIPNGVQKLVLGNQPMRISKQKDEDSKSLRLDRHHFAALNDAELALSNFHIPEAKNKRLVLYHEFITPIQGMIMNPS
jgi:hypothetical protein